MDIFKNQLRFSTSYERYHGVGAQGKGVSVKRIATPGQLKAQNF
jgi:hypothetical protein